MNGEPVEAFDETVFGDPDINLTTLEADIFRGSLNHEFSETSKAVFSITSSEFENVQESLCLWLRWNPGNYGWL